jgi:MFS-type transporter involved in bile tolerance (Atg22 family)
MTLARAILQSSRILAILIEGFVEGLIADVVGQVTDIDGPGRVVLQGIAANRALDTLLVANIVGPAHPVAALVVVHVVDGAMNTIKQRMDSFLPSRICALCKSARFVGNAGLFPILS